MVPEFRNEPLTDFSIPANRQAFQAALDQVAGTLGRERPLLVGGVELVTDGWIESANPGRPDQLIGRVARVGVEPFGGYDMSGTCSRAGGHDYLQQFMQSKVVSELL